MKKMIMTKPKTVIFTETEEPKVLPDDVLIKPSLIGICGSDMHVYHGLHPFTKYPVVPGHEVVGKIVEIGSNVVNYQIGDFVTIMPQLYCGHCSQCLKGRYNICENLRVLGFQAEGTASERFAVHQKMLIKLNKDGDKYDQVFIEPLAVAVHAVKRCGDVKNKNVLIFGAGTIGNLLSQVVSANGAKDVFIADLNDHKLNIAQQCGIDHIINLNDTTIEEYFKSRKGYINVDVMFDCAGASESIRTAINTIPKGSTIVVVAVFSEEVKTNFSLIQDKEIDIKGSLMYIKDDFITALSLIENKKIKFSPLITKVFKFDKYEEGYKFIDSNYEKTMKVLIKFD